jgi:C-terminal processing protease CtpA/Prc
MKLACIIIIAIFMVCFEVKGQSRSSSLPIDSMYQLIKTRSVHRNGVDWKSIDRVFYQKLDSAHTREDSLKSFVYLFKSLNDVHSAIYYQNKHYGYYKGVDKQTAQAVKPLLDRAKLEANKIRTTILAKQFGYIQIPFIQAFGDQTATNAVAQAIEDSLCKIARSNIKGFIIDLRLNEGGNMHPMLGGLKSFFAEGMLGGIIDESGKQAATWQIRNGQYYHDDYRITHFTPSCLLDYSKLPVVVLLSSITRSSGEATAIAFKGRPHTYFIGVTTAGGYTTSNQPIYLRNDLFLNLAVGYFADRKGSVYKTFVTPDLVIKDKDDFDNLGQDAKIQAAVSWLKKSIR